ncbi:type II toxin-antitoxin system PemK/MazF family toxin [Paenibacillus sp. EKM202P]|uniref:type II toxin-antitoxin system PemK/MazF family toxin n=1 Tax=unclassified Paenibacillus TaxID=185978 RepID=UPI0013EDE807|nr:MULTISPECIES: type II toxin-antitoxin system PemK/MazF family toxin [unclassified Paenibacillus]KAF6565393.1 type II toxin-antitoxin system PemK/MazF family toxin [Paenibacillus sp. EKM202P]KAF6569282.1 type II toxin-antitoxin system PemK/MazF family toxin [Paenibacillus sp. EKM207P]
MAVAVESVTREIKKMDVWIANLGETNGVKTNIQKGQRPVIVMSNNIGNKYSPVVMVVPLSAQTQKANLPTHVLLDKDKCGFDRHSVALFEQMRVLDKKDLACKVASIPHEYEPSLNSTYKVVAGIN